MVKIIEFIIEEENEYVGKWCGGKIITEELHFDKRLENHPKS